MISITVKSNESIDKALKRLKRKFMDAGVVKELRERQAYSKPSVGKRQQKKKAIYVAKTFKKSE
jgi:small subunit ribosomal protein S21